MNFYIEPERHIPVIETDVFVAGAGAAGCMAAIAAARTGARVMLVEKLPVPCGALGNGGNVLYSYFNASYDPDQAIRIVGGLPYEFLNRCVEEDMCYGLIPTPKDVHANPFTAIPNREGIKGVLCLMLQEAGVSVLLQTLLVGVVKEDEHIRYAIIENKDSRTAIRAKVFIDCSGDADIAKYAELELAENWHIYDQVCGAPTSLPFGLGGIDFEKALQEASDILRATPISTEPERYLKKYKLEHTKNPDRCKELCKLDLRHFSNMASFSPGEATSVNNSKGSMTDASSAENLTRAEMEQRIKIMKMVSAMRKDIPGFENAHLIWEAIQLGIRSSKIVVCEKMLTEPEVSGATRFDNEIGLYGFQDMVEKNPSTKIREPGFYGLPYEMLIPKKCSNLYVAGRCVTLDLLAHNSTRNTVCCMVMGQAAGVAAGLCVRENVGTRDLPYSLLKKELLKQQVILDV